ncbi:MAG: hypothetical protein R2710_00640 [Acidimicrobiales bacterium]
MSEQRQTAIAECMEDIRNIEATQGVTRSGVEAIEDRLLALTAQRDLFPLEDFPPPSADEPSKSRLYRIAQDDDDRFVLYANASRGVGFEPVHNGPPPGPWSSASMGRN